MAGRTKQVGFRLPVELIEQLDAFAARRSEPGLRVTRTDAACVLLSRGLEAVATTSHRPHAPARSKRRAPRRARA